MGFANQATSVKFTRRSASLKAITRTAQQPWTTFARPSPISRVTSKSGIRWYVPEMSALVTDNMVLFLQRFDFRLLADGTGRVLNVGSTNSSHSSFIPIHDSNDAVGPLQKRSLFQSNRPLQVRLRSLPTRERPFKPIAIYRKCCPSKSKSFCSTEFEPLMKKSQSVVT